MDKRSDNAKILSNAVCACDVVWFVMQATVAAEEPEINCHVTVVDDDNDDYRDIDAGDERRFSTCRKMPLSATAATAAAAT